MKNKLRKEKRLYERWKKRANRKGCNPLENRDQLPWFLDGCPRSRIWIREILMAFHLEAVLSMSGELRCHLFKEKQRLSTLRNLQKQNQINNFFQDEVKVWNSMICAAIFRACETPSHRSTMQRKMAKNKTKRLASLSNSNRWPKKKKAIAWQKTANQTRIHSTAIKVPCSANLLDKGTPFLLLLVSLQQRESPQRRRQSVMSFLLFQEQDKAKAHCRCRNKVQNSFYPEMKLSMNNLRRAWASVMTDWANSEIAMKRDQVWMIKEQP